MVVEKKAYNSSRHCWRYIFRHSLINERKQLMVEISITIFVFSLVGFLYMVCTLYSSTIFIKLIELPFQ